MDTFCSGCNLVSGFRFPSWIWVITSHQSPSTRFVGERQLHLLLVNKVTCREYKVGEKGGKGFGCLSKKEEECMQLFWGGQQARQT